MPHFPGIGHFSEHPHLADHSPSCSSGADYRHSDPAHCHLEANSASSGYYITSWAPHSYPTRAITGPSFRRSDYASWGADYRRGRGSWAIISTSSSSHHLIIFIVSFIYISFMYFVYVFPTLVAFEIPCFWYYTGINCITCSTLVLSWIEVIQIYQFLSILSIILFYFLYSYLLLFLKHVVSLINTRNLYHSGGTTSPL